MSEGERKLADSRGKFVQIVENGRKLNDVEWIPGRILLSNKRLVLASNEGKKTIPLADIRSVKTRQNVNEAIANVSGYVSIQTGRDVFVLSPADVEGFAAEIYSARLDQQVVLAKHPQSRVTSSRTPPGRKPGSKSVPSPSNSPSPVASSSKSLSKTSGRSRRPNAPSLRKSAASSKSNTLSTERASRPTSRGRRVTARFSRHCFAPAINTSTRTSS